MPFECKKYHGECKGRCCGAFPIPIKIWRKNQKNIQRPVSKTFKVIGGPTKEKQGVNAFPVTEDGLCPFLKKDLSCAIYDERPEVCRKFGDESHILLCCPMQKADGTPRTDEEKQDLNKKSHKFIRDCC